MNWMTMKSFTSTMPCIPSTIPDRIMAGFCKGKPIAIGFESPTNPGRKRVNINGSLNAHEVTDVIVREFYEHYAEFREAALDFFKNIGQYKSALESLLTLNFRIVSAN